MNKDKEIILSDDLNIDMLSEENEIKNNLMDVYHLSNLIIGPTCFKRRGGTLIVKNRKRFHKAINVFCGFSDHHKPGGLLYNKTTPITTKTTKEGLQIFKVIQ